MVRPNPDDGPDADNWYAVQDRRERKRVQDRLAQRARRKRLAELKKTQSEQTISSNADATGVLTPPTSASAVSTDVETPVMYRSPETSIIPMPVCIKPPESNDLGLSSEMPMNVWTALYINGSMMGLGCSTSYPAKSRPADPSIPSALQPTPLQMITIHPQWIDRFPFPQMRDNLINAISLVEEEEFLRDLFCMTSFDIKRGGVPWDPSSWIIKKEFHAKWGFLFMEQIP